MSIRLTGEGKIYNIKNFGKVLSLSIGSSRKVKGEFVTDFFNAKILGEQNVEYFLSRSFAEKDRVSFEGSLTTSSWEKEGVKRTSVEIIVNNIEKKAVDTTSPVQTNPEFTTDQIPF